MTKFTHLEEHCDTVVGIFREPRLLLGEAVARYVVRLEMLEVQQVRVLAVNIGLPVMPCVRDLSFKKLSCGVGHTGTTYIVLMYPVPVGSMHTKADRISHELKVFKMKRTRL